MLKRDIIIFLILTLLCCSCTDMYSDIYNSATGKYRLSFMRTYGSNIPSNELFRSNNDGTLYLSSWADPDMTDATVFAGFADFNNDGRLDLVVVNSNNSHKIFFSDKNGSLGSVNFTSTPSLGNEKSAVIADFNRDGFNDVFVIQQFGSYNYYLQNDGTGNLIQIWNETVSFTDTKSICAGDFDRDGDIDIFLGIPAVSNELWINDLASTGSFVKSSWTDGESNATTCVISSDFDRDGYTDILEVSDGERIKFWRNNRAGGFEKRWESVSVYNSTYAAAGDLNGNGFMDAYITNSAAGSVNTIIINNRNGTFSESEAPDSDAWGRAVTLGDIDIDGDIDAVVSCDYQTTVYHNSGNGNLIRIQVISGMAPYIITSMPAGVLE